MNGRPLHGIAPTPGEGPDHQWRDPQDTYPHLMCLVAPSYLRRLRGLVAQQPARLPVTIAASASTIS